MTKKDRELFKEARKTLLDSWFTLTQAQSLKIDRLAMADRVCDVYEALDSHLSEKK